MSFKPNKVIKTSELWPGGPATYKVIRTGKTGHYTTMFILGILIIFVLLLFIWFFKNVLLKRRDGFDVSPSIDHLPSLHNNDMQKLHEACTGLSKKACQQASFCTLLNGTQCVGGNQHGPTYYTNNGNKVDVDSYHHRNKCYGNCN